MGSIASIIIGTALFIYVDQLPQRDAFINDFRNDLSVSREISTIPATPVLAPTALIDNVPFTSQAPFGEWSDPKLQYGCEEATLLMAMHWVNKTPLSSQQAKDSILSMSDFELQKFGDYHDISIADTLVLLQNYFGNTNAFVQNKVGIEDIKNELAQGNLVIIPVNGRVLNNPNYTPPGPERHQILVIGYDDKNSQLIVHDPGTSHGKDYRYSYNSITESLRDYKTGFDVPITETSTAMLVIRPRLN